MKILTKQDLYDYLTCASILGCGGGGSAEYGKKMIDEAFEKNYKFTLVDINEIKDDKVLCILVSVGGGVSQEIKDKVAPYTQRFDQSPEARIVRLSKAADELSKYIGKDIFSYVAAETGAGNGMLPMYLNARGGKPSVDGDACGRAKPEMGLSLTKVADMSVTPLSMVSPFMETVILKDAVDDYRAEDIVRSVAVASGGGVMVARCPGTVKEYKNAFVHNQISLCIKIGKVIREAKTAKTSPEYAFEKASGAVKLFEGKVKSFTMEGKGGFNWGDWYIDGEGTYKNQKMRIWFKNEYLIAWIDDKPKIMCPDLICVMEKSSFEGLSNFVEDKTHNNKVVSVYGIKAVDQWRTPKGIEIFGPKHFGFDLEYKPLEK